MLNTLSDTVQKLRREIILREHKKFTDHSSVPILKGAIAAAFPSGDFPIGVVHEFLTVTPSDRAASFGFTSAITAKLMNSGGLAVWVGTTKIFPHALKSFGLHPKQLFFVRVTKEKQMLQATEMVLQTEGVTAVISEATEIGFTESRRLQLATERSMTTAFLIRNNPKNLSTASVSRWRIRSASSDAGLLPGLGHPRWTAELLRIRNGKTGKWLIEYADDELNCIDTEQSIIQLPIRKIV